MPIYEYKCEKCELETEHFQNIGDDAPRCEICGHVLKKIISLSNFFLKDGGCGWGKNGYSKQKETKNVQ
jgi:putative FmdB family regulatory protein